MVRQPASKFLRRTAIAAGLLLSAATPAMAAVYQITPLVTDSQEALAAAGFAPAPVVDPNLVNPWGMSFAPTGPFWVSNQGTGTSTLYDGEGTPFPPGNPLVVTIPAAGPPAGPTGQVFAGGTGLTVPGGAPAVFLFANLDGSISAWTPGTTAAAVVVPKGTADVAVYTGLAISGTGEATRLYAANNAAGRIDVFDSDYALLASEGAFLDPGPNPLGLAPFNVKVIGDQVYVTYAIPGPAADEAALGTGFVSVFDLQGNFVRRFATGGQLVSPWGLALAPDAFGQFSNALLIGNFSEELGYINAFDPDSGAFLGLLEGEDGLPLVIPDLWELLFGNGAAGANENDLYFAAGIGDEEHGLFGEISAIPEPASLGLLGLGVLALAARRRRPCA